ncbi:MAG: Hsp20/alpha crystallin family protein [Chloroflexota bacterium]
MADDQKAEKPNKRATGQHWAVQGYIVRNPRRRFTPPSDIIETDDRIIVLVEIAGMRGDSFKISLYNQSLIIGGVRARVEIEEAAYHQAEIGFGEFKLEVPMPWSVERDNVNASYTNGFLRIELPRQQARRVHIVDINTEHDES